MSARDSIKVTKVLTHLFIVWLCTTSSIGFACEHIHRATEFPPCAFKTQQGQWQGADVEILTLVFSQLDCSVTFSDLPFARAMKLLKKGDINSMAQLANTPERTQFIDFIGPYYDEKLLLVTTAEVEQDINVLTDLIKLPGRIGMQRGIFISEAFDEILSQNDALQRKIFAMINPSLHIAMVRKQRLAGFFVERNHFNYLVATREGYEGLKVQPIQLSEQPVFYGFSKAAYAAEKLTQISTAFSDHASQISTILSNYGINPPNR